MTPRRPDLDDLAVLVLVAQTGSIGRAAVRLGLSQPSVSRRMTALESSLRVPLLYRETRGTTLTPAGKAVVDWATVLLAAADDFTRSVQTLRVQRTVAVRAAVSMTLAEHLAPRWLTALRQQEPDALVSLTVVNSTEVAALVEGAHVDIGFVESPSVRRGLRRRRIGTDTVVVAVAPGHEWATTRTIAARTLAATPLLVREPGSGTRETIEHALERAGLELLPGQELASNTALKSAAVAGMGPVVLSALAVADELAAGRLVQVSVRDLDLTRPFQAVWRAGTDLSPSAMALLTVARNTR
jgi:DNA-binding transcriptional LysR family regulator